MKHLLLSLLLVAFASTCALADSPEAILKDYQKQSAAALVKLNGTLEQSATPLIATLIKAGDTAGAEELTAQLKAKLAGEPVPTPQASAVLLFAQYDQARAKALEPAQKAAVARIDTLLSGKEGKNLQVVTELGKARAQITAGQGGASATQPPILEHWTYHATEKPDGSVGPAHGELRFHGDGTVIISDFTNPKIPHTADWKANARGDKVTLTVPGYGEWKMEIKGTKGTLDRPETASPDKVWGLRYLRAQPVVLPDGAQLPAPVGSAAAAPSFPMRWSYHLKPDRLADNGFIEMKPDGTLVMGNVNESTPGTWSATSKTNVLDVVFETTKGRENCQMRINGNEAELVRPIGTRYLKAR